MEKENSRVARRCGFYFSAFKISKSMHTCASYFKCKPSTAFVWRLRPRPHLCFFSVSIFFSTKTKENIFAFTSGFFGFHLSTLMRFNRKHILFDVLMLFHVSSTLKRPKSLMAATAYDSFSFRYRFPKLPFSPVHTRNGRFSKRCRVFQDSTGFWNRFGKSLLLSAFSGILVCMDDRPKRRKYAFLNLLSENLTMWHWIIYSSSKKRTHDFNTFMFILKTAIVIRPQFDWIVLTSNPTQQNLLVHLSQ